MINNPKTQVDTTAETSADLLSQKAIKKGFFHSLANFLVLISGALFMFLSAISDAVDPALVDAAAVLIVTAVVASMALSVHESMVTTHRRCDCSCARGTNKEAA